MATHLRIHLGKEREPYEQPSLVLAAFAIPAWADVHLAQLLAPANRVGFLLQLGYFQISQRFYVATRYHAADIATWPVSKTSLRTPLTPLCRRCAA